MVQWIRAVGSWATVRDMARNTVNKDGLGEGAEVSQRFRRAMLVAEHSPIRTLRFNFLLTIKSWISVHFVRHKIGVEHFVTTQRDDRTGVSRDDKPQAALVNHCMDANAQALIAISRKRLCPEVRTARQERSGWPSRMLWPQLIRMWQTPWCRSASIEDSARKRRCAKSGSSTRPSSSGILANTEAWQVIHGRRNKRNP